MPQLPLADVRVLDLSRVLAGPLSAMVLADLGADVIKVEQPQTGDGTRDWGVEIAPHDSSYFSAFNRSKRSITLDLGAKEDQAVAFELAAEADVLVENFRAGTAETFGLGYEALKAVNPKLVYCAVAGYDRQGAEADRPGYDLVLQGETGLMSINGAPDGGPLRFGLPVVDMFTGMSAAHAILGALLAARASGVGRRIDIALFDAGLVASSYFGLEASAARWQSRPLRQFPFCHRAVRGLCRPRRRIRSRGRNQSPVRAVVPQRARPTRPCRG